MERLRRKTLPAWPDPMDSLGQKVNTRTRRIGGSSVWFPRGPALERYNGKIRPEVERILNNVELPEGEKMMLKMYMIGRSEQRANPTVMICCPDKATRKRAEALIRESELLERQDSYGFGLGSAGFPLEATFLPRPLGKGIYLNANETMEAELKVDVYGLTEPGIGRKLGFVTSSQNTRTIQYATGGPIVQIGDKSYQLTVAHAANSKHCGPKEPQQQDSELDECDFDGQSDEEEDEHMILSRGSISPGWPMRDADLDSDQARSQQSSAYSDSYTETPDMPNFQGPRMMWSPKSAEMAEEHDDWKSSTLLGSFPMPDGYGGELDYLRIHLPENIPCYLRIPTRFWLRNSDPGASKSCSFQQLLTVVLSQGLREGDSGSALIDARTGDFYGYVILGADGDCVAYALPSPMIMANITTQFQHLPSFPRASEYRPSDTLLSTARYRPMENPPRQRRPDSSRSSMPSIPEDMTQPGNQMIPLNDQISLQRHHSDAEREVQWLNDELRIMRSELEGSREREVSLDPDMVRDMQIAMSDEGFREPLRSLEQWFYVVGAGQQGVALHTLLRNANPAHVDYFRHVLRRQGYVAPLAELFAIEATVSATGRSFPEEKG